MLVPDRNLIMSSAMAKLLFPSAVRGQRRRNLRFFFVGVLFGAVFCVVFGAILYLLNIEGRI